MALTWQAAWLEAWSNRRGFWTQVALMCINNVVFVVFWLIFFGQVDSFRGWDADRVLLLLAMLATVAGVVIGLLHNVRRLGYLAADGGLDAALSLPVPPLIHLALRRVEPVSVGDLLFGVVLFFGFTSPSLTEVAIYLFGVATGSAVLIGFFIIVGSLGFFAGRSDAGDTGLQAVLLFSHYPIDIFPGLVRVFLYVVVPAGFVSVTPTKLIDDFSPAWAGLSLAAAICFVAAGHAVFSAGLRRYTSGAVWTEA